MPKAKTKKKEELILDRDAAVLRKTAATLPVSEIGSRKTANIITTMKKALHQEDDGVAIAAPQIGESLRIFVVKGSALLIARKKDPETEPTPDDLVFINPEIIKRSQKKTSVEEGCLSVRWLYGEVLRHDKVTIKAYNEKGELLTIGASGLIAQIFQHEVDHLDGILFTDKAENVRDLPPTEDERED